MKKIFGLILIGFFLLGLLVNANAQMAPKKFRIGLSTPASDNPFWTTLRRGAESQAKEMTIDLLVKVADENQVKQLKDVEDFLQMKLDLVIAAPIEREGSQRVFEACKAAGVPALAVGRKTVSEIPFTWIGMDDTKVGRIYAEWVVKRFPNGCHLAWLRGPAGAGSYLDMEKGAMSVWEKYPNIKVVFKQAGRDNRPTGMKLAEDALQALPKGQLDIIVGGNDELGLGAASAVEAAGRTEVLVTGQNGTADAIAAVRKGKMALTVLKPSGILGTKGVELAIAYLKGKRDFPKLQYVEPIEVTPENIDKLDLTWAPK